MSMKPTTLSLLALAVLLSACNLPAAPAATSTPLAPPAAVVATDSPAATDAALVTFEPARYQDELGRYEFDYPAGWTVSGDAGGSRGSYVQFTSWVHEGSVAEIPADGMLLQVAVYLWDPKHDLAARVEMRKTALLASGNTIIEETPFAFASGQSGVRLLVQDTAGMLSPIVIAELGEDYLELSGVGDAALLDAIMQTFRITL
jgi:hypothetical protein